MMPIAQKTLRVNAASSGGKAASARVRGPTAASKALARATTTDVAHVKPATGEAEPVGQAAPAVLPPPVPIAGEVGPSRAASPAIAAHPAWPATASRGGPVLAAASAGEEAAPAPVPASLEAAIGSLAIASAAAAAATPAPANPAVPAAQPAQPAAPRAAAEEQPLPAAHAAAAAPVAAGGAAPAAAPGAPAGVPPSGEPSRPQQPSASSAWEAEEPAGPSGAHDAGEPGWAYAAEGYVPAAAMASGQGYWHPDWQAHAPWEQQVPWEQQQQHQHYHAALYGQPAYNPYQPPMYSPYQPPAFNPYAQPLYNAYVYSPYAPLPFPPGMPCPPHQMAMHMAGAHTQQPYPPSAQSAAAAAAPYMASPDAGYADSYSGEPWSSGSASGMEPSECSFATQAPGSSDTVTVSAHSAVKDAAGAVAKVLERRGSCLLLALRRRGETDAECSHIAAKTLAVSRFYINTSSAAADQQAGGDGSSMREVTFLPFRRGGAPDGASSSASTAASTVGASGSESFGFMVFAQPQQELEVALPPARHQSAQQALPAAAAAGARPQEAPQVLKAAAGTDVNKLANAVIHHVLERGRCVLQLAGAGACHTALRALARARARLASKFDAGMLAAAAFNTEDTSGSLGRASVFLRIDVVRCALAQMEGAAWALHGGDELRLASA